MAAGMLTFPNVLITAHQAFLTHESSPNDICSRSPAANLHALDAGDPLRGGSLLPLSQVGLAPPPAIFRHGRRTSPVSRCSRGDLAWPGLANDSAARPAAGLHALWP